MNDRYSRQGFLGEAGQRAIETARVGFSGLGGGGSHLAPQSAHLAVQDFVLFSRRQLLVGKTRSETFSSPNRIRTFNPFVNSRLLTSGEGSLRRADRDPEPNRFELTTRRRRRPVRARPPARYRTCP